MVLDGILIDSGGGYHVKTNPNGPLNIPPEWWQDIFSDPKRRADAKTRLFQQLQPGVTVRIGQDRSGLRMHPSQLPSHAPHANGKYEALSPEAALPQEGNTMKYVPCAKERWSSFLIPSLSAVKAKFARIKCVL